MKTILPPSAGHLATMSLGTLICKMGLLYASVSQGRAYSSQSRKDLSHSSLNQGFITKCEDQEESDNSRWFLDIQ